MHDILSISLIISSEITFSTLHFHFTFHYFYYVKLISNILILLTERVTLGIYLTVNQALFGILEVFFLKPDSRNLIAENCVLREATSPSQTALNIHLFLPPFLMANIECDGLASYSENPIDK